ncbi:MAG: T9SS type A sorting domain-containing protein [Bacteroidetes bacterium]|nr:T9SS type A sorting domain-containing protein [Bacteroidota bacterium]
MKRAFTSIIICVLASALFAQGTAENYPPFSWDKVPVYMHSGDRDGLSDEEVAFVATHCSFYCFEKAHGVDALGSTEAGTEFDAQRLKAVNPDIALLYYWNTFLDYPFAEAHTVYENHPEWWLYKQDGTLDLKKGRLKRYDLSNPEVREWWSEEVRKAVSEGSCDGVFMDAFPQIASEANITLWGQEKYDSIQDGLLELIRLTREKTDTSAILMFNGIRNTDGFHFGMDYIDITDASAIEHFDQFASTSKENIQRDMEAMMEAGKRGKIVILKTFPGFNWTEKEKMSQPYEELLEEARENITFPLACFLIAAQPYSYFNYSWGYSPNYGTLEWHKELDRPLGKPLGDAVNDGWVYTREFEHVKVWVNLETKEAEIEWGDYVPLGQECDSMLMERLPGEMGDSLLFSFIPDYRNDSIPAYSGSSVFTTEYQPSGSQWHEQCKEEDVYLARLSHRVEPDSLLWDLRIGKGGAIYSFIGPYGEGVPPQYRSWDFNTARWVDDLWQTVCLSTEKHNADEIVAPPGSTLGRPQVPSMRYFIHGAGVYMNDTMFARTNKPFYSPLMAAWHDSTNRALHTMNWGQQAHIPSIHRSQLLYTYKYKDLGSGIMEASYIIQNFGDHKVDYINAPWGGVRALNLPQCWLSHPNDSLERTYKQFGGTGEHGLLDDINESGGYFIWAAGGDDDNRPAMAIVFGKDRHYDEYQSTYNMRPTRIRWGDGSADINRSYSVFTVNPRLDINPGATFYYRAFYINGTMKEVQQRAKSLVSASDYGFISMNPTDMPTSVIQEEELDSAFTQDIQLFASPVEHMVPLFLMEDRETGKRFISPDLYHNASILPFSNPYGPAHEKYETYQDRVVYRPYSGNIKYIRLLGYGVNKPELIPGIRFALLDALVRDTGRVILEDEYINAVWVPVEPCDTCGTNPTPEPGFMLYNDFGEVQPIPWTDPVHMSFTDRELNPEISEDNPSELTGKVVRDSGLWANVHFNLPETVDLTTYSKFRVKAYYKGDVPVPDICKVRLILRNDGNGSTQYSLEKPVPAANQWVDYEFDCSGALGRDEYNQAWLFVSSPDINNTAIGHTYFIDELKGPPVRIPENYTATFSISSKDTGGKLSGIPVTINDLIKQSNLRGEAVFTLQEGSHNYSISESGYFPVESSLELQRDTTVHIELYESTSFLKFRIYSGDLPLNQVQVKVGDSLQLSNQVGIAVYENLPRFEEYTYSIEKEGYLAENELITIVGDTTVNVNLQLLISAAPLLSPSIELYPNPTDFRLFLKSDLLLVRAELFTVEGTMVRAFSREELSEALNLTGMSSGMYLLKIYPENEVPLLKQFILSGGANSP